MKNDGSDLREIIMMNSGAKINPFGNLIMITNRQKAEIPMNFMINAGSKILDEIGEILVSGQKKSSKDDSRILIIH